MLILENYLNIKAKTVLLNRDVSIVVVTKGQNFENIKPIIDQGHLDFGENKVQEAFNKWSPLVSSNNQIRLHLVGRLQSNKAKQAFNIFQFIHSLDNEKLAKIFSTLEHETGIKKKYFIQVNIANEEQKAGISLDKLTEFSNYCVSKLNLNILGLMCLPPVNQDPKKYFTKLKDLNALNDFKDLSMGMSNDYEEAIQCGSTHVRVGSAIFN
jgi:pyridoxal phosphate enzyme (YggS family)